MQNCVNDTLYYCLKGPYANCGSATCGNQVTYDEMINLKVNPNYKLSKYKFATEYRTPMNEPVISSTQTLCPFPPHEDSIVMPLKGTSKVPAGTKGKVLYAGSSLYVVTWKYDGITREGINKEEHALYQLVYAQD